MRPLYKITLWNAYQGNSISTTTELENWKDISFILERTDEYGALLPVQEESLIFNGSVKNWLMQIITIKGIDSTVHAKIGISTDGGDTYDDSVGILNLEEYETFYQNGEERFIKVPFNEINGWQKLMARKDIPIKINGMSSIGGAPTFNPTPIQFNMRSQIIPKRYRGITNVRDKANGGPTYEYEAGSGSYPPHFYAIPQFYDVEINEAGAYTYPLQITESAPSDTEKYLLEAENDGTIFFEVDLNMTIYMKAASVYGRDMGEWGVSVTLNHIPADASTPPANYPIFSDSGDEGGGAVVDVTVDITSGVVKHSFDLKTGDKVYFTIFMYARDSGGPTVLNLDIAEIYYQDQVENRLEFRQETLFPDTVAEAYSIHDVMTRVIGACTDRKDSFYSEFLGNDQTTFPAPYAEAGKGSFNVLMSGLNVRGFTQEEKPFSISFADLWVSIKALYGLVLTVKDNGKVYCEPYEDSISRDTDDLLLQFVNVDKITETAIAEKYINNLIIGFEKWKAETDGDIDDPQTKHTYNTRFSTFGEELKILSKFYCASLGIESSRRVREATEATKIDEEAVLIATKRGANADMSEPELAENFISLNNLNTEVRYNLRHTPKRMLLRQGSKINSTLAQYSNTYWKFAEGEGNVLMEGQMISPDRGDFKFANLKESQDLLWDYDTTIPECAPIWLHKEYKCSVKMTYAQFKLAKQLGYSKPLAVNGGGFTIYGHIFSLKYYPWLGVAELIIRPLVEGMTNDNLLVVGQISDYNVQAFSLVTVYLNDYITNPQEEELTFSASQTLISGTVATATISETGGVLLVESTDNDDGVIEVTVEITGVDSGIVVERTFQITYYPLEKPALLVGADGDLGVFPNVNNPWGFAREVSGGLSLEEVMAPFKLITRDGGTGYTNDIADGVFAAPDGYTFQAAVYLQDRWQDATIEDDGTIITVENGLKNSYKTNPSQDEATIRIRAWLAETGSVDTNYVQFDIYAADPTPEIPGVQANYSPAYNSLTTGLPGPFPRYYSRRIFQVDGNLDSIFPGSNSSSNPTFGTLPGQRSRDYEDLVFEVVSNTHPSEIIDIAFTNTLTNTDPGYVDVTMTKIADVSPNAQIIIKCYFSDTPAYYTEMMVKLS